MSGNEELKIYQVITSGEAAELLGVTRRQISRLCQQGKLIHRDSAGSLLILKSSVEEYALAKKQKEQVKKTNDDYS